LYGQNAFTYCGGNEDSDRKTLKKTMGNHIGPLYDYQAVFLAFQVFAHGTLDQKREPDIDIVLPDEFGGK